MKLDHAFLRSRVARRVFLLFVLCALLPVALLAGIALTSVTTELEDTAQKRLHSASKAMGMSVIERLGLLETQMGQVAAAVDLSDTGAPPPVGDELLAGLKRRFLSFSISHSDALPDASIRTLLGPPITGFMPNAEQEKHLASGKAVIWLQASENGARGVILVKTLRPGRPRDGLVLADVNPDYLWGIGQESVLPAEMELSSFAAGAVLATTHHGTDRLAAELATHLGLSAMAAFEWRHNGERYLAGAWTMPMAFQYKAVPWTMVLSERRSHALAPIRRFVYSFVIVVLLALAAVTLLSSIQIRTSLVPLERLQEGTRRIAAKDFSSRIRLSTRDEFEDLAASFNSMAGRLERQFATLETVGAIDRAILSTLEVGRIVELVLAKVGDLLPCEAAGLVLLEPDGTGMAYRRKAAESTELDVELARLPAEDRAALASRPRHLFDGSASPAWAQLLVGKAQANVLAFPLMRSGDLFGVLALAIRATRLQPDDGLDQVRQLADQVTVALTNAKEVQQRRQAEQGLQERNAQLREALEELKATQKQMVQQERLRALGQMASGIAHDFNNALYPIMGFTELLLLDPKSLADAELVKERLQTMNLAARDAAKIVSRLRDFYRPREQHDVALPVDLNALIRQVITLTEPKWKRQAQMSDRTIEVDADLGEIGDVGGDESELREVLTNLLFNAVDAIPQRGRITFRTCNERQQVVVRVADTGTGMTDEVRQRCLEPFFSTKGEKGTGLGLAMVYGIVRRFGGTVDIESELGKGTTFVLRFPVLTEADRSMQGEAEGALPTGWHVLVVDDDKLAGKVTAEYVRSAGHHVDLVQNGLDAMAQCQTRRFDLLITDLGMPDMNGRQLASLVKKLAPAIQVVLISGAGDGGDEAAPPSRDIDDALDKPVTMADLQAVFRRAAQRQPPSQAA